MISTDLCQLTIFLLGVPIYFNISLDRNSLLARQIHRQIGQDEKPIPCFARFRIFATADSSRQSWSPIQFVRSASIDEFFLDFCRSEYQSC